MPETLTAPTPTYRIRVWDHEDEDFVEWDDGNKWSGLTKWEIRPALREIRKHFAPASYLVEREDANP